MNNQVESTYALIVRSREKAREVLETVLYIAFILSAVLLIWEFAQSSINAPAFGSENWAGGKPASPQAVSHI